MSATNYPNLFQPLQIGNIELPNRALMGSMHTNLEEAKDGFERLAAFYAERVRGGVGLIVTGGIGPNPEGAVLHGGAKMTTIEEAREHEVVTNAVHHDGGRICMQILHAGRYAYTNTLVAPSAVKAPTNPFVPRELTAEEIEGQIQNFVDCALLAKEAGYDGVEVMGSEGYFINEFIASKTNIRDDDWGGIYENRTRLPITIVSRIREALGPDFVIIYRLSMLDLVDGGSTLDEVIDLAKNIEAAGASIINTGIGWHEARIPTIAPMVPRGAFAWVTANLRGHVSIPTVASNRINTPEIAEKILANDQADMVSMARPFLADPEFMIKAQENRSDEINTCIACNQACLDHTFQMKITSCLVNPRAAYETELNYLPAASPKKLAVVGAGPAGLSFAVTAAGRGHSVTLFEAASEIGGQLNIAKTVPGKKEFYETIRYFNRQLELTGVDIQLNTRVSADDLRDSFDEVIVASGVTPRAIEIDGVDHPMVLGYLDVFAGAEVGDKVAVIGAGGIGFDVAEFLTHEHIPGAENELDAYLKHWGIDRSIATAGGVAGVEAVVPDPKREVHLLQRKNSKVGAGLGKTTGWIHRTELARRGVIMHAGVQYDKIDDEGIHLSINDEPLTLQVDHVVVCAGQESLRTIADELGDALPVHVIGGADVAAELDAKRAIDQGCRLAAAI